MNKLVKICTFIFIFCILWRVVFNILWLPKNSTTYFYKENKNTLDIVYIGSSNANAHFNSLLAYDLYGFKTGLLSIDSQPFIAIKYLIKESEKYQKPSLYIIDITRLTDDFLYDFDEEKIRKTTDSMKFSQNRINAINDILKYANISKKEYINYYFSFLMYHNSWKNIDIDNFKSINTYKGFLFFSMTTQIEPQEDYIWNDNIVNLPQKNHNVLQELMDYIKKNNLNVLFVIPKKTFWYPGQEMLNDAVSIIDQNGFKVINFNKIDDMGINPKTDFYNSSHLNVYGATKYTLYLSNYLADNYHFLKEKSLHSDSAWDNEYERFKQNFKDATGHEFSNLIS